MNSDQKRLRLSALTAALAWFVVATMIALYRPDLPVSRFAYAAGMLMGVFMLGTVRGLAAWLPSWWRTALVFIVPVFPLHLAVGCDFYLHFPPGVSTTRVWRGIRVALYVVCGILFVFGPLIEFAINLVAPERLVPVRDVLFPVDRWLQCPSTLVYPLSAVAIIALVARNYGVAQREEDRRRLRWVLWGTFFGLLPFLTFHIAALAMRLAGVSFNFTWWNALVNLAVLIPISFGYAIIKHHVFDITFVIRRGLQHLLAKNALRVLLALPIAGLAYGVLRIATSRCRS